MLVFKSFSSQTCHLCLLLIAGLLATLVGTVRFRSLGRKWPFLVVVIAHTKHSIYFSQGGRAAGDLFITAMGLISIRNLLNLLILPGAGLVAVSILLIRYNYEILGV